MKRQPSEKQREQLEAMVQKIRARRGVHDATTALAAQMALVEGKRVVVQFPSEADAARWFAAEKERLRALLMYGEVVTVRPKNPQN